jgi:hypothetical protein
MKLIEKNFVEPDDNGAPSGISLEKEIEKLPKTSNMTVTFDNKPSTSILSSTESGKLFPGTSYKEDQPSFRKTTF